MWTCSALLVHQPMAFIMLSGLNFATAVVDVPIQDGCSVYLSAWTPAEERALQNSYLYGMNHNVRCMAYSTSAQ